jgi:hypothetical protein
VGEGEWLTNKEISRQLVQKPMHVLSCIRTFYPTIWKERAVATLRSAPSDALTDSVGCGARMKLDLYSFGLRSMMCGSANGKDSSLVA